MVDHVTRKIIDLIDGRDKEIVSNWLAKFPNIKILTRDGSVTYRQAISNTSKNIIQISDRFHLIKNLSEALTKHINATYSKNIILFETEGITDESIFEKEYNALSPKAKENYDRKSQLFNDIKSYYNKCNNYSKTCKKFNIDRRTVKEYVHMDKLPIIKRKSTVTLDKYRNVIIDNIDKKATDIFKIIQKEGYKGNYSNLIKYINRKNLKASITTKNIFVNRTNITEILNHKGINDLNLNKKEKQNLKELLKKDKTLNRIIKINDEFSIVLFSENPQKLDKWIENAKELNIPKLNTVIKTVEDDIDAVKASIANLQYSNGLIEGKNCKAKLIKRMMYGRCGTKLYRAKLLQLG